MLSTILVVGFTVAVVLIVTSSAISSAGLVGGGLFFLATSLALASILT